MSFVRCLVSSFYLYISYVYISEYHANAGSQGDQERVSDGLMLELQEIMSYLMWLQGIEP